MRGARFPRALTVAGADPSAGAGVLADLKVFAAHGVYGTAAITALTVQDTRGVYAVERVRPALVRAQIGAVFDDLGADAVKTGMLGDGAVVTAVAETLARHGPRALVVDPVLRASSGAALLAPGALGLLRERLLPFAAVVTPNLAEAAALVGFPVGDLAAMEEAARALLKLGPRAVVITGGHLSGDAVDLLLVRGAVRRLRALRVPGPPAHGTGCTFSAAIAAELAKGASIEGAVRTAKRYTTACLRRARRLGRGRPLLGHFPPLRSGR